MNRHERRAREAASRTGGMGKKEALAKANTKMRAYVRDINNTFDSDFHAEVEKYELKERIPCKEGCAYCCYQLIMVNLPEAMNIVANNPKLVQEVLPEIRRQENLIAEIPRFAEAFQELGERMELKNEILADWHAKWIPCMFLDKTTKRCRIYNDRPIGCRNHIVLDTTAESCKPAELGTIEATHWNGPAGMVATHSLMQLSSEAFNASIMGPFQSMLLYAYEGRG